MLIVNPLFESFRPFELVYFVNCSHITNVAVRP